MCGCLLCCTCYEKRPCQLRWREGCVVNEKAVSEWTFVGSNPTPKHYKCLHAGSFNQTCYYYNCTHPQPNEWGGHTLNGFRNLKVSFLTRAVWTNRLRLKAKAHDYVLTLYSTIVKPWCQFTQESDSCFLLRLSAIVKVGWFASNNFKKA